MSAPVLVYTPAGDTQVRIKYASAFFCPANSLYGPRGLWRDLKAMVYFGDQHDLVHLLERHFPVRRGQAKGFAATRRGGLPAPAVSERVSAGGATRPE
jgi:hypothetical protein